MLTDIAALEPKEQANRLKEVEKLPLKAENLMRIQVLRNKIEALPNEKHSMTQYSRFLDSEYSDFSLSPEILSEKLYDSVKMIRDLMTSNKKLKDMVKDLTQDKKNLEAENIHLQNENQELLEKLENRENIIKNKHDNRLSEELLQLHKEKDELLKKIVQLEKENKSQTVLNSEKTEWG